MTPMTMQAAVAVRPGAPLEIQTIAVAQVQPRQVLIKVVASSVNPLDTKISLGQGAHAQQPLPAILGIDVAGIIVDVGAEVQTFKSGDEVFAMAGGVGGVQGTHAQYIAVDADLIALKPGNLSMAEAAALPLVFITAWEGLVDRAQVKPGQQVLIQGGAGGVGHVAVQIAKAMGAQVFATGSAANRQVIERLGAVAIDYRSHTAADYLKLSHGGDGFDIVYDTVGGAILDASFTVAKRYTGHVVSCLGWGEHSLAPLSFRGATYSGVFTLLPLLSGRGRKHHGEILAHATRMAEAGQLSVMLNEQRFTLDTINEAFAVVAAADVTGKTVIEF